MRKLRPLALICLAALMGAPGLYAQPAETPPEEDETALEQAPEPETAAAPEPEASEDPFDYEASEQISEDLSVSFPVDI